MIVVGTTTPDLIFPSTACLIQAKLGGWVPCFRRQRSLLGFVFALGVADKFIRSGDCKHVLVIGTETLTRMVDWNDRTTCVLFGDGAGAVVLKADEDTGIPQHPPACRWQQEGTAVEPGRRFDRLQATAPTAAAPST
jgi:3-oxoacyl-[acyl-carrier-protein] synthase-3